MNDLARVDLSLGLYDKAATLAEEAAVKCDANLGDRNPKTLAALNTLALIHYRQGKLKAAQAVFERLLVLHVRKFTDDHPTANSIRNNLDLRYRSRRMKNTWRASGYDRIQGSDDSSFLPRTALRHGLNRRAARDCRKLSRRMKQQFDFSQWKGFIRNPKRRIFGKNAGRIPA